ncbi:MAG: hypothetical protein ACK4PI_02835 [Tepidisphaerales bacterium]
MAYIEWLEARRFLDATVALAWAGTTDLSGQPTVPGAAVRVPLRVDVRNVSADSRLTAQLRFVARPVTPAGLPDVPLSRPLPVRGLPPESSRQAGVSNVRLPQEMRPGTYRLVVLAEPPGPGGGEPLATLESDTTFDVTYRLSSATPSLAFRLGDVPVRATFRGPGFATFEPQTLTSNFDLLIRQTDLQTRIAITIASPAAQIRNINANVPVGVLDLRRATFTGSLALNGGNQVFLPPMTTPTSQSVALAGSYRNLTFGNLSKVNIIASAPIDHLRLGNAVEVNFLSTRSVGRITAGSVDASNFRLVGQPGNASLGRFTSRAFSNTRIFAQQLGGASLGAITFASVGRDYGVSYDGGGKVTGRGLRPYQVAPGVEPLRRADFVIGNRSTFNWGMGS